MSLLKLNESDDNRFFEGNPQLEISDLSPAILEVIQNKPITDLELPFETVSGQVSIKHDKEQVKLAENADYSLNAGAEAYFYLGIFEQLSEVVAYLSQTEKLRVSLEDEGDDDTKAYVLITAGYSLEAGLKGNWAFSAGSASLGLSGDKSKRQAIIRRFDKSEGTLKAIQQTFASIRIVTSIDEASDISENTTILVTSDGKFSGSLGVKAGYDFSWVYSSTVKGLEGDIGLKANLGGGLNFGYDMTGTMALALTRGDEPKVRLQTFKHKSTGWNFAANLSAKLDVKADEEMFKNRTANEVIKATLGVQAGQVFESLEKIRDVLDEEELKKKIKGFSDDILKKIFDTNIYQEFKDRKEQLVKILDRWDELGEEGGTLAWELLDKLASGDLDIDLTEVRKKIGELADMDDDKLEEFLKEKYGELALSESWLGEVLEDIVPQQTVLDMITESELRKEVQKKLGKLRDLLDVEGHVEKLHEQMTELLRVERIREAIAATDEKKVGEWLEGRIDDLLASSKAQDLMGKLKDVQKVIDNILKKKEQIYESVKKALNSEYGASLKFGYQSSKEDSSLIDASFDFGGGHPEAAIKSALNEAIKGNYDAVLLDVIPGVTLSQGRLTHGISRKTELGLTLPYMSKTVTNLTKATASADIMDHEDGRLVMFELVASNTVDKDNLMSKLTLNLAFERFIRERMTVSGGARPKSSKGMMYSFKLAKDRFRVHHMAHITKPFINLYVPKAFSNEVGTADDWVDRVHTMALTKEGSQANRRRLGKTLLGLKVEVPAEVASAWYYAPEEFFHPVYREMAFALQQRLKELVFAYFLEYDKPYSNDRALDLVTVSMYRHLRYMDVYEVNPRKNRIKPSFVVKNRIYDEGMFTSSSLKKAIEKDFELVRNRLSRDEDRKVRRSARRLRTNYIHDQLKRGVFDEGSEVFQGLASLYRIEFAILNKAFSAASKMDEYRELEGQPATTYKVQQQLSELADFGADITRAFNKTKISLISNKRDYTRYLGPDLFIQMSKVLHDYFGAQAGLDFDADTKASLELIVLDENSDFEIKSYLDGELPKKDVLVSQLIGDFE